MRNLILGIDSGTQSTKVLAVDTRDGKVAGVGSQAYDLNLRHQFGPSVTAWIAGYADSTGSELLRVGGQYDYHKKWFHFVPSGEIEMTRGASLSLYSELGYKTIAIVGYSRTNLKTFFDLLI